MHRAIWKDYKNFDFILQDIEYLVSPEIYISFRTVIYWEIFAIIVDEIDIQFLIALTSV